MTERGRKVKRDKSFTIHPDVQKWSQDYYPNKSFQEVNELRNKKLAEGEPIHETDHDAELKETARNNTDNATIRGWKFPYRKR
jgi:hypothetical protein